MTAIVHLDDGRKLFVSESRQFAEDCLRFDGRATLTMYTTVGGGPRRTITVYAPHVISVEDE